MSEKNPKDFIHIKGARSNNLKNIEVYIPKNKLVVVTGPSGSGKSSLIMDTLYAEGQRRYVESLSSYARQFLSRMKKPEVDFIHGICPAIAIEQKVSTSNARSTVGSLTEIYDYLRLLFGRIGVTYSPVSGKVVKKHVVTDVVDFIKAQKTDSKIQLFFPLSKRYADRSIYKELSLLLQKGYTRVYFKKEIQHIEDLIASKDAILKKQIGDIKLKEILVLVDRFVKNDEEENLKRIADSVQTAFQESHGEVFIQILGKAAFKYYNNRFELDGMSFIEPTHQLFNYNNPYGACPKCEGYGRVLGIDPNKVIPNRSLSIYENAIACWKGEKGQTWLNQILRNHEHFDFPIHRAIKDLTKEQENLLWEGNEYFSGINEYFGELEKKTYKIQNRVLLARYRGRTVCNECKGGRLRKEAQYVKVGEVNVPYLVELPIDELVLFFEKLKLSEYDQQVASRILLELNRRLQTMNEIGLGYLTLNRVSSTLSGGETQRINLTRTLGSNLTNSLYILDEPSIGLHPKDTEKLVKVLEDLRNMKNTVIVVEHEEEVIRNADHILDIGPNAGIFGGELVFNGDLKDFKKKSTKSLTADYLYGRKGIEVPETRRPIINKILIKSAFQHNLKNIDVTIPLNNLVVVTGVSGSGKTTLVKHILYPAIKNHLEEVTSSSIGFYDGLSGDLKSITKIEMINQNPIGKSSRSNPITYVGAYDSIRKLYSSQQLSRIKGFEAKHFSFNVDGGRCENCKGDGEITVEMQFLADVKLICEDCNGRRFNAEVLEVKYNDKNIFEVLDLSIEEALEFFKDRRDILTKIEPLFDVGLGYIKLGQASSTLSGGEAQRVKLASYLGKESALDKILFIFDEPTTGLHFNDIHKLLKALNALIEKGHSVIVVEHNIEVIKTADYVIDLGPDGGKAGGNLVFQGRPEDLVKVKASHTGRFLKGKL